MGNICCNDEDALIRKEKKDEKVSKISNVQTNTEKKDDEKFAKISSNEQINPENNNDKFSKILLNEQIITHKKTEEKVPKIFDEQIHNEKKKDEKISKISNEQINIEKKNDGKVPKIYNDQLINSEKKIDGKAPIISNEQDKAKGVIKANNIFPRGSEYEKELNSNFKYFNVFWYDQNKTNDFNLFKKCFENVQFYKAHELNSIINFFKKESISEWIVITTGSKGKELIQNLESNNCIKSFFIYCQNTKLHESWAKNIKKVGCITSNPEILCQKFIEFNNSYYIPHFNYKSKMNNIEIPSISNKIFSENLFGSNSLTFKDLIDQKKRTKGKYNNLCIKIIHLLEDDEFDNDLKNINLEGNSPIILTMNIVKSNDLFLQFLKNNLKCLALISLYFSKYPFLYNLFTLEEIDVLFKSEITFDMIVGIEIKLFSIMEKLSKKIMENECILDEKDELKEIQISCIYLVLFSIKTINKDYYSLINYYQFKNLFRDIDFCLKLLVSNKFAMFNNEKINFLDEINISLTFCEIRYPIYLSYFNIETLNKNKFTEEEKKILNDSLTIKDFIIIGDKKFHEKIKTIEKNIKSNSLRYLSIEQISNYVNGKLHKAGREISTYFYFLIVKLDEFQKNLEKFVVLSMRTGISFIAIIYVENENNMNFYKEHINFPITTVFVYSPDDIINYLSQELKFINPLNFPEPEILGDALNIKIPKITFEQNDEDIFQNGCFELSDTFDINLIKNKLCLRFFEEIDYVSEFSKNIYNIYKEHNALDLFYSQNCLYFGWKLYPELFSSNISFVKRILYMYCREEVQSQKSFYRIINGDLRSRDPYKIYRYIDILALINELIDEDCLASFEGYVYRATKLDENLIMKLVTGVNMVNTTFWSTSKDFNVADSFMKRNKWRNSFIICKTVKNNIDIEIEQLNPYNEKEVLFLPFTVFRVEKISSEIKYGKKIFKIELTDLGIKNFVNSENMHVEDVKTLGLKNKLGKFLKNNGEELGEINKLFKDFDF